jgi:hypothetical protein
MSYLDADFAKSKDGTRQCQRNDGTVYHPTSTGHRWSNRVDFDKLI